MSKQIEETKESVADVIWSSRNEWVKGSIETLAPRIEVLVRKSLQEVSALDEAEEAQAKKEIMEDLEEYIRRGLNRAIKGIRKQYAE